MSRLPFRVGYGYDIHRLVAGRLLILGGIKIDSKLGLEGHSDADCLTHAIADSILGAVGLKDIGHYFPPTDPSIAGIDSQQILKKAVEEAFALGYSIGNVDASIIAEKPKIIAYVASMKEVLAKTMGIDTENVGIKATTHEGLGDLGAGLGIAASSVCLLIKNEPLS